MNLPNLAAPASASNKARSVLFLVPYPLGIAPSQRFRFEQYFAELDRLGVRYEVRPFLDTTAMAVLYRKGSYPLKVWKVLVGFVKRVFDLTRVGGFDTIFIHREAVPLGPPVIEWLICKMFNKRVVFDFDDAIWLKNTSEGNPFIALLKRYRNADDVCKWATVVSCGNAFLCQHAQLFNAHVVLNPTTIDTVLHHNRVKQYALAPQKVVVGWTGTHSTIPYLERLMPTLIELRKQFDFELLVIADRAPSFSMDGLRFVKWAKETEIDDLLRMDVGIMPLDDDEWSRGKCGFKALQYMSLGIPALVSPVGVNTTIVTHGTNGYLCGSEADWQHVLTTIFTQPNVLPAMSKAARQTVEERFSVQSNTNNFLDILGVH